MKKLACLAASLAVVGLCNVARAQTTTTTVETETYHPAEGDATVRTTTVESTSTAPATADMNASADMNAAAVSGIPPSRGDDSLYATKHAYKLPFNGAGLGFLVGGGISNFTASLARESTQAGGGWDATLIFGTRQHIALEAGYNGTLNDINSPGLSGRTKLIGNGATGMARINFTKTAFQPFVVGGLGWKHYALTNDNFNNSNVRGSDNVVEIPMGAGFAYRFKSLMVDARGVYKYALNSGLFSRAIADSDSAGDLHNWGARVNLGFEL